MSAPKPDVTAVIAEVEAIAVAARGLGRLDLDGVGVADALRLIGEAETATRMIGAWQARLTAHVVRERTTELEDAKKSARNVAAQTARDVGAHRGLNASRARRAVDAAVACPEQAPQLFREWVGGRVGEEKVISFFDETGLLTRTGRAQADDEVADVAGDVGTREWRERLRSITQRLEPELAAQRAHKANEDRHVHVKGRADGLMDLSARLPGTAGQGIDTILSTHASRRKAAGDERTTGQIKADLLTGIVIAWARATGQNPPGFTQMHRIERQGAQAGSGERDESVDRDTDCNGNTNTEGPGRGQTVTEGPGRGETVTEGPGNGNISEENVVLPGFDDVEQACAAFARYLQHPDGGDDDHRAAGVVPAGIGVQVHVVITDLALFGITESPAEIFGLGSAPAAVAREMISAAAAEQAATLQRLYTDPVSGALVSMESRSRAFPEGLAQLIGFRDRFCRHPYCDSAIRHLDHIHPHAEGGSTSFANGQGLCAHHNLIKDTNHTITTPEATTEITTPEATAGQPTEKGRTGPATDKATTEVTAGQPTENAGTGCATEKATTEVTTGQPTVRVGTGSIVTRLVSGAEFTSPARAFPHEDRATVASEQYWAGFRQGRIDAETALEEREVAVQVAKDKLDAKQVRLISIRRRLTVKAERLHADGEKLGEQRVDLRIESRKVRGAAQAVKEARDGLERQQVDAEVARAAIDEAQASIRAQRQRVERSRSELDQAWEDLVVRMSQEAARSQELDEAWLNLLGEPELWESTLAV